MTEFVVSPARKQRGRLTEAAVIEIYSGRPDRSIDGTFVPSTEWSKHFAEKYEVSDKTVREIWNRKCWTKITRPLCTDAEIAQELDALAKAGTVAKTRKPGRPRGAKDTVSRKRKLSEADRAEADEEIATQITMEDEIDFERSTASFRDPFQKDWKHLITTFDLNAMVGAFEVDCNQLL